MMMLLECLITRLHSNLLGYIIRTVRMSRLLIDFTHNLLLLQPLHKHQTAGPKDLSRSHRFAVFDPSRF